VASQLHYRALVQLVGELAWTGSADTDFHTLIGRWAEKSNLATAVQLFLAD
jgi:hypothetical protein